MNVLIIDDDPFVTVSLKTILEADPTIFVSGTGNSGDEAVTLYHNLLPDILLMDIRMEQTDGLTAAKIILSGCPDAKILFLTTFSDDDYIIKALHLGAKGYLLKQDFESIVPALKAVYSGQSVFGGDIVMKLPSLLPASSKTFRDSGASLAEKEQDIIALVAQGLSNREIAETLFLSEGTIRNYMSSILEKLHLRDRTQVAIYFYQNRV